MKAFFKNVKASLLVVPALVLSLGLFAPVAVNAACSDNSDFGAGSGTNILDGANCSQGNDTPDTLLGGDGIFTTIVNILLYIIGAIAVIMLIIGGIRYVTSGGDSSAVTAAKNTILYAIIGIIVALLAYAIVNFVLTALLGSF